MANLSEIVIYEALKIIQKNGGTMRGSEVSKIVGETVQIDEEGRKIYEKTGNPRWWSALQFRSIGAVKAGFLVKKKGIWSITTEGENALTQGVEGLARSIHEGYQNWRAGQNRNDLNIGIQEEYKPSSEDEQIATLEQIEDKAHEGIKAFLDSKNPYEFQDIVAALLRGMGYHTPFVAPKGPDGGVDIVAYRDPLGTINPRIKVQVKHRESKSGSPEITQLHGLLQADAVGIFVSSGGFTSDAIIHARNLARHIELIDLDRLIELWVQFYDKLKDEEKTLLPLTPIYFLTPENQ